MKLWLNMNYYINDFNNFWDSEISNKHVSFNMLWIIYLKRCLLSKILVKYVLYLQTVFSLVWVSQTILRFVPKQRSCLVFRMCARKYLSDPEQLFDAVSEMFSFDSLIQNVVSKKDIIVRGLGAPWAPCLCCPPGGKLLSPVTTGPACLVAATQTVNSKCRLKAQINVRGILGRKRRLLWAPVLCSHPGGKVTIFRQKRRVNTEE